jgi:hypothetical protein
MTVDTMALPGVISDAERKAILHGAALDIAADHDDLDAWVLVMGFAHTSLCRHEVADACRSYAEAVRIHDDLAPDGTSWPAHYPELDGPDRGTAAMQIAEGDEVMNVLLSGKSAR